MKKLLLGFVAILGVLALLPALASIHGSAPLACSFTTYSSIDGCSGASTYLNANLSYQNANLLAAPGTSGTIFQSGQTLASSFHVSGNQSSAVNWNVAGLDFPVGIAPGTHSNGVVSNAYCTGAYVSLDNPKLPCSYDTNGNLTPLIDAAKYDWAKDAQAGYANAGCASGVNYASGGTYPYVVQCAASASTNISGFDFGPANAANSYSPVCVGFLLRDNGSATSGTINFKNNRIFWSGDASCLALPNEYQTSYMVPIYLAINITNAWTINVWNNFVDQNAQNAYNTLGNTLFYGYSGPITIGSVSSSGTVQTAISIKYNFFSNLFYRAVTLTYACGGFEFSDNVTHNIGEYSGGTHGEIFIMLPQTGVSSVVHCPNFNYANGSYPVTSPSGWAGSSWGTMPYFNVINNVAWTDSTVSGDGSEFLADIPTPVAPELLDIQSAKFELNTLVPNIPQDAGSSGRAFYFMYVGSGDLTPNTSGSNGYSPAVNDILSIGIPACNAGGNTRAPTVKMQANLTSLHPADSGDCGYSNPGTSGAVSLTCVYCANHSPGFVTGWTVSGVSFVYYSESVLALIAGANANGNGGLNGGYTNYESLTVATNLFDVGGTVQTYAIESEPLSGHNQGQFLSCNASPPQLPSGSTWPFFSLGNGYIAAHASNNFKPDGTAATLGSAQAVGNGC